MNLNHRLQIFPSGKGMSEMFYSIEKRQVKLNGTVKPIIYYLRGNKMISVTASEAQSRLYDLIEETWLSHKPLIISGKKLNAVLISEEDWESVQETLYLLSIPNMRESIREGLKTPVEECIKELDW
jgi:prevent-host-death family protein